MDDVVAVIDEVHGRGVPHNVGRNALRTQLVRIGEQAIADRRGEDAAPLGLAEELRTDKVFQRALGSWWPAVSASALVRKLLSSPSALRAAAAGVLTDEEQQATTRVVVVLVLLEVLGEVLDALREQRDLDLGGSSVTGVRRVLFDDRLLDICFKCHRWDPLSPRCALPGALCLGSLHARPFHGNLKSLPVIPSGR